MKIRPETPSDAAAVRAVNLAAFGTSTEANLVERLREQASPVISLVAEDDGSIAGHIFFSLATLSGHPALKIMGLAPMAVLPNRQRRGIGSMLVRAGLDASSSLDFDAVVVLGHAEYYPRFGFRPASQLGIGCEYDVPDEVFMVLELKSGVLHGKTGTIQYHSAFKNL
jgi:putative acetyltransferase